MLSLVEHEKNFYYLEAKYCLPLSRIITKTRFFKYVENFTTKKENFQIKNSGSFHSSAQNIDCGYSL